MGGARLKQGEHVSRCAIRREPEKGCGRLFSRKGVRIGRLCRRRGAEPHERCNRLAWNRVLSGARAHLAVRVCKETLRWASGRDDERILAGTLGRNGSLVVVG